MIDMRGFVTDMCSNKVVFTSGVDWFSNNFTDMTFFVNSEYSCLVRNYGQSRTEMSVTKVDTNGVHPSLVIPHARIFISHDRLVINSTTANIDNQSRPKKFKKVTDQDIEAEIVSLLVDLGGEFISADIIRSKFKQLKKEKDPNGRN